MQLVYHICLSETFTVWDVTVIHLVLLQGGVAEEFYHGFGSVNADGILKEFLTDDLYEILMA